MLALQHWQKKKKKINTFKKWPSLVNINLAGALSAKKKLPTQI